MKINISKQNARFIVQEDRRKVICIIDNTDSLFLDYARGNLKPSPNFFDGEKFYDNLLMPDRFIGIATCSKEDQFDAETGKFIAYSRAKDKVNHSFFKRAKYYINTMDNWMDQSVELINSYGEKIARNSERRQKKLDELISR